MKYAVTTAVSTEPVSLADTKLHLRTVTGDTSEDSAIITPLISAAREYCENFTGRALAAQTIKAYPESWASYPNLWQLPMIPVVSVTSVKYYDESGTEYTLDSGDYQVDLVWGTINILDEPTVTLRELNPIVVEYSAGYTSLPKTLRQAMLMLIAHWYQNREAVTVGTAGAASAEIECTVSRLLYQYKAWWM
jgi:phage conserved hypothetical protein, phiE125 gp8 family